MSGKIEVLKSIFTLERISNICNQWFARNLSFSLTTFEVESNFVFFELDEETLIEDLNNIKLILDNLKIEYNIILE